MTTHTRRLAGVAFAGLLLAAGCGDDGEAASDTTAPAEESTTSTTAEPTTTTAAPLEDVTEPVTTVYLAFFDNFSADLALLEDGETFTEETANALRERAAAAGSITVDVKGVTALDEAGCEAAGVASPCAEVAYDLVVNGEAAVPDQTGYAVQQDGEWKVAKTTFCSLASMGGLPEGC